MWVCGSNPVGADLQWLQGTETGNGDRERREEIEDREQRQGTKTKNNYRERRQGTKTKNGEERIRKDKDGEKGREKSLPGVRFWKNSFLIKKNSFPGLKKEKKWKKSLPGFRNGLWRLFKWLFNNLCGSEGVISLSSINPCVSEGVSTLSNHKNPLELGNGSRSIPFWEKSVVLFVASNVGNKHRLACFKMEKVHKH